MKPGLSGHVEDDQIEQYSMGAVSEVESERIEQHLLVCKTCRNRLQEADIFVRAMQGAAAELERERQPNPSTSLRWRPVPWLAAAAATLVLIFAGANFLSRRPASAPLAISLQATRGSGIEAKVPAGLPLVLKLDVATLDVHPAYRVEVVDQGGREVWSGKAGRTESILPVSLPGLAAGVYFVRVYATEGPLLREYGLEVRG